MEALGWRRSVGKGCWEVAQVGKFVGFVMDLREGMLRIPEEKVESMCGESRCVIKELVEKGSVQVRKLASLGGS